MVSGSDRHATTWQQTLDIPGAKDLLLDQVCKDIARIGEAIEGEDIGQTRRCTDASRRHCMSTGYEHRKTGGRN
jgi:hypothetical protein